MAEPVPRRLEALHSIPGKLVCVCVGGGCVGGVSSYSPEWWHRFSHNSSTWKVEAGDQEFKIILGYIWSLKLAWLHEIPS